MHLPEVVVKITYSCTIPVDKKATAGKRSRVLTYQCIGMKSILQSEQSAMKLESHARPSGELVTAGAPKRTRRFIDKG